MMLFAFGYFGGLALWILVPTEASFSCRRWPYFLTLGLFIIHKWEERHFNFFPALSNITGVPAPEAGSVLAVLLYAFAAAWLLVPVLVKRKLPLGYYLAWTFFFSLGVTELAHFVFPLFAAEPYGYFPGMLSVLGLAPAAWWGLKRLV